MFVLDYEYRIDFILGTLNVGVTVQVSMPSDWRNAICLGKEL